MQALGLVPVKGDVVNWKAVSTCIVVATGGCAGDSMNVQTKLTGSDFCKIVPQKLTWDVKDTKQTIRGVRKLNGKWDKRCGGATS